MTMKNYSNLSNLCAGLCTVLIYYNPKEIVKCIRIITEKINNKINQIYSL